MIRRALQLVTVIVLAAGALGGCTSTKSGSGSQAQGPESVASSSAPGSTSQSASASAPSSARSAASSAPAAPASSASSSRASMPHCTSDIRVIPGESQGAAGHIALVLIFNNVSRTTTCEIIGYPSVDLVDSHGATVAHLAKTLRGLAGGEPDGVLAPRGVVLAPGHSASALAEASDVPQGGITDCGSYSLRVTVPSQTVPVSAGTATLPRCEAQIHPVVAGTTGGMG